MKCPRTKLRIVQTINFWKIKTILRAIRYSKTVRVVFLSKETKNSKIRFTMVNSQKKLRTMATISIWQRYQVKRGRSKVYLLRKISNQ